MRGVVWLAFQAEVDSPRKGVEPAELFLCGDARSRRVLYERPAANVSAGLWQVSPGMDPCQAMSITGHGWRHRRFT